jgi:hypothetical protein
MRLQFTTALRDFYNNKLANHDEFLALLSAEIGGSWDSLTPTALAAGNTNDYTPAGFSSPLRSVMLRLTPDAAGSTLTGLVALTDGHEIAIQNIGSGTLTLASESTSSTAANRFTLANNASLVLAAGAAVIAIYDGTSSRWRVGSTGGGAIADGVTITGSGTVASPLTAIGAAPSGNAVLQSLRHNPSITPGVFTIATVTHNWSPANFATTTLIRAQANDNEGSRVTGMLAGNAGDIKVILNVATPVDDGILCFEHENTGSTAANRFICPNEDDYFIPKSGAAICVYDGTLQRWMIVGSGGRHQQSTVQQLGFFPESTTSASLSGTADDWEPTAAALQGVTYASGLGAAGASLLWKDATLWRIDTAAAGFTLTGATTYDNDNSGGHSPVKILINVGTGNLTLKHNNASSLSANRFLCPGDVDVVVGAGEMCILVSTSARGWNVLACPQADGQYTSRGAVTAARLSVGWQDSLGAAQGYITPAALPNAQTDNWNPTGFATAGVLRATGGGASCVVTGMAAGATGDIKIIEVFDAAITFKWDSASSTLGNRFKLPSSADLTIPAFGAITFRYDSGGYWWCIGYSK